MGKGLIFDKEKYCAEALESKEGTLVYRAFRNIVYIENPVDDIQKLNIFVPEEYYQGKEINGYGLNTAPVFMPNTVGGYKPGPASEPCVGEDGNPNTICRALQRGYVVVSAGARGRSSVDEEGKLTGMAPAVVCDMKAAVRYLRYNADSVPGNVERIITNGTSAGGALSSLMGATGDHPDYEAYLKEMGAAKSSDAIYAASCYCPITNLDHADMAYEWEFTGVREYRGWKRQGELSEEQMALSAELAQSFPEYLNSLQLKDENGNRLSLDKNGDGSFKEIIKKTVLASAQKELDKGKDLSDLCWLVIENGKAAGMNFAGYVKYRTRMKDTPAFDNIAIGTAENELFGAADIRNRHFTQFSFRHSKALWEMAEEKCIKMMNPMNYIEDDKAVKAKYYRIRHGAIDRDTSLAIPVCLHVKLMNRGVNSDLAFPWGIAHAGDYDLEELFDWIDSIV